MPPELLEALLSLLGVVLTIFVVPAIRAWAAKSKATIKELEKSGKVSDFKLHDVILKSLRIAIADVVSNKMEKEYPAIAAMVLEGALGGDGIGEVLSSDDIRNKLYQLGAETLNEVKDHFMEQGVDIVDMFGYPRLGALIRAVVDSLSPWPGERSSEKLADPDVAKNIKSLGLNKIVLEIE